MAYIDVIEESKFYGEGENRVVANDKLTFQIEKNEFAVIVGPSGAGKSTVLNMLGGMDSPSEGELIVDGIHIENFSREELTNFRRNAIGFIFQNYNLISNLTAKENVELSAEIAEESLQAEDVLKSVGLADRMNNFPAQLSGGEQQRVAIARAIVSRPKLLLCDEPTGALDYETGKKILDLLHRTIADYDATVIVITHNRAITPMADRVIDIADAQVRKSEKNDNPTPIEEIEW